MKTTARGFTLIEVLVVISIIGILASIIIIALHNTRTKAYDARIKSVVNQLRALGEVYYHNNDFSFSGYDTCISDPATPGNCPGNLGTSMIALKSELDRSKSSAPIAQATLEAFCVGAPLASDDDRVFCKDSDGRAGDTDEATACSGAVCTPSGY